MGNCKSGYYYDLVAVFVLCSSSVERKIGFISIVAMYSSKVNPSLALMEESGRSTVTRMLSNVSTQVVNMLATRNITDAGSENN